MTQNEQKVHSVQKQAKLRRLNDEEKELNAEERDAREKYQSKNKDKEQEELPDQQEGADADTGQEQQQDNKPQLKHLDIYV